jgi:hypothetical protein
MNFHALATGALVFLGNRAKLSCRKRRLTWSERRRLLWRGF